jgi:hypothetical protein
VRGTGNMVLFEAKLAWGDVGVGGAPKLIFGCGRNPEGLRFELEIESEFNWKTKSHKIQRLEFVSDKIEGRDSKR